MDKKFSTKGKHIIVDTYGIDPQLLDNISYLRQLGRFSIAKSGAVLVDIVEKKFLPFGCTLLFLLEESHLSFHTFIEDLNNKNSTFLSLDMYTCGSADPEVSVDYILQELKPDKNRTYRQYIERGVE